MSALHYGRGLEVKIERGALVIRIGAETLAHACSYSDWANPFDEAKDDYIRTFAITDPKVFADDVRHAMLDEREDGSTPLSDFLDKMTEAAVDDGSMACEYEQSIPHGQNAAIETWAIPPPPVEPKQEGWQPISTAPKDSTTVIGYCLKLPERWIRVGLGNYLNGDWSWHQDVTWRDATHWQPLPPPPAEEEPTP